MGSASIIKGKLWGYALRVAGITFRVRNMDEVTSDDVVVERQSDNPHDACAIAVYMVENGAKVKHLGFLPKEVSRKIQDTDLPATGKIVWKGDTGLRIVI